MTELLQFLIAALLAYIAWQNYKINDASFYIHKDKLRLDLFDRRYGVFDACKKFFLSCIVNGSVSRDEFSKFVLNTSDAQFLFGGEIKSYIDETKDKCIELMSIERKLSRQKDSLDADSRAALATKAEKLEQWLTSQHEHLSSLFNKYLRFVIDKSP